MLNKRSFEFSRKGYYEALNYTNELSYRIRRSFIKHFNAHKDLYWRVAFLSVNVLIVLFILFTTMPNPQPYANPLAPVLDTVEGFKNFIIHKI